MVSAHDGAESAGRVHVRMFDHDGIPRAEADWQSLDVREKLSILSGIDPTEESHDENITCVGHHEWIVVGLDENQPSPPPASDLALGRSDTTPQESDTVLNDEVGRTGITSYSDEGDQIRLTTLVDEGEANVDVSNGETISEVGIYADNRLLNHAVLGTNYEKDNSKTMTVEVVLSYSAA